MLSICILSSDWKDENIDENLVDAVLLNVTRIGHGYAVTKHPLVRQLLQTRRIPLEICPISNQVCSMFLSPYIHTYGRVIIQMAIGECSAYTSLQVDSNVKFAFWPTSWRPPGADRPSSRLPKVNSHIWLAPSLWVLLLLYTATLQMNMG